MEDIEGIHSKEDELVVKSLAPLKGAKPTVDFFSFFYDLVRDTLRTKLRK